MGRRGGLTLTQEPWEGPWKSKDSLVQTLVVFALCSPVLTRYVSDFKGMVHRGGDLRRRKSINPHPKRSGFIHYRDIVRQNEWLRATVFDSLGNYLYCNSCVRAAFGVSKDRLTRQRNIKCRENQEPTTEMSKAEVEQQRLGEYIIMPPAVETSFSKWWRTVPPSTTVEVRTPHARHGNAGKPSHAAKPTFLERFLEFVDCNSQPNGRSADSTGPIFYFSPQFTTIQMPKKGVPHYKDRLRRSVVGEFNRTQRESGLPEMSNGSSHNWLRTHRPKLSICPHQEDYCDTCSPTTRQNNIPPQGTSWDKPCTCVPQSRHNGTEHKPLPIEQVMIDV